MLSCRAQNLPVKGDRSWGAVVVEPQLHYCWAGTSGPLSRRWSSQDSLQARGTRGHATHEQ